jgi:hypothetical protein
MTQDDIIEMANIAELCQTIWIDDEGPEIASLVAFAKLVAAKEREACASINFRMCLGFSGDQCYQISELIRARGEA